MNMKQAFELYTGGVRRISFQDATKVDNMLATCAHDAFEYCYYILRGPDNLYARQQGAGFGVFKKKNLITSTKTFNKFIRWKTEKKEQIQQEFPQQVSEMNHLIARGIDVPYILSHRSLYECSNIAYAEVACTWATRGLVSQSIVDETYLDPIKVAIHELYMGLPEFRPYAPLTEKYLRRHTQ